MKYLYTGVRQLSITPSIQNLAINYNFKLELIIRVGQSRLKIMSFVNEFPVILRPALANVPDAPTATCPLEPVAGCVLRASCGMFLAALVVLLTPIRV